MSRWTVCLIRRTGLVVWLTLLASGLTAQDQATPQAEQAGTEIVPADEERALGFARAHHPELVRLLERMKTSQSREYVKAVRELSRVSERLARQKQRAPERYEVELELWKTQSRLRLLVALASREGSDAHKERIRDLLLARNELKIKALELDRKDAEARLEQIKKQLGNLQKQQKNGVDQELDRMVRSAHGSANRLQNRGKNPSPVKRSDEGDAKKKSPAPSTSATADKASP